MYFIQYYGTVLKDNIIKTKISPFIINDGSKENRIQNIKFHVQRDDYFGTLATIIDLIRQEAETENKNNYLTLKKLTEDLLHLQENYKIIKKK